MKAAIPFIMAVAICTLFSSCDTLTGEEVARISIKEISTEDALHWESTELDLEAGEKVHFWSQMNLEYQGELGLRFQVQLIRDSDTLGLITLDPMEKDITMGEIKTEFGNETKWRWSGRMNYIEVEEAGHYTFRTILVSSENETLQLKQSDLVLKK